MEENNLSKCSICGKPPHKESKYCIFHASAEEKTEDEFKERLKEYIQEIKEEDKDYNFYKFVFVGNIDFKKDFDITVFEKANFTEATFEGDVHFTKATFKGSGIFTEATFKGEASFTGASFEGFEGAADFSNATFKGTTYFIGATFKGAAGFTWATFEEDANFDMATFERFEGEADFFDEIEYFHPDAVFPEESFKDVEGDAWFNEVIFNGKADFTGATFTGVANFTGATFEGDLRFGKTIFRKEANFSTTEFFSTNSIKGALFEGNVIFKNTILPPKNDLNLKVNGKGLVLFKHACLENIFLELDLDNQVQVDFFDSMIGNTKIRKKQIENRIYQETIKDFPKAKEVYLLFKNNFHSIGKYDDESWAFRKEKDMDRLDNSFYGFVARCKKYRLFKKIVSNVNSNLLKRIFFWVRLRKKWLFSKNMPRWLILSISDFIYQYGENPWRVIRFAFLTILFFAGLLNISGIVNSDKTNMIINLINRSQGDEYTLKYLGPVLGSFLNCLYFSVVTFTTLGYGDFQPLEGWSRFLVSSEALLGAFTMALFVYTFARRTGGR